jgi:SUMO ligase MMS21 Smc5/6 complex component
VKENLLDQRHNIHAQPQRACNDGPEREIINSLLQDYPGRDQKTLKI